MHTRPSMLLWKQSLRKFQKPELYFQVLLATNALFHLSHFQVLDKGSFNTKGRKSLLCCPCHAQNLAFISVSQGTHNSDMKEKQFQSNDTRNEKPCKIVSVISFNIIWIVSEHVLHLLLEIKCIVLEEILATCAPSQLFHRQNTLKECAIIVIQIKWLQVCNNYDLNKMDETLLLNLGVKFRTSHVKLP